MLSRPCVIGALMLSRSGLELNEIWGRQRAALVETDEGLSRMKRAMQADPGDKEAESRYHHALHRSGEMAGHVDAFERARQVHYHSRRELDRHYASSHHDQMMANANKTRDAWAKTKDTLNAGARARGVTAGIFHKPEKGQRHFDTFNRLAEMHRAGGYSWDQETMGENEKIHFFDNGEDARDFGRSVRHHFGDHYHVTAKSRDEDGPHFPHEDDEEEPHRVHIKRHEMGPRFGSKHEED